MSMNEAYELLEKSVIYYRGEPVGTAAAVDPSPVAANYHDCFVRDFVSAALVFLIDGRHDIVRNFLRTVMTLRGQHTVLKGHTRSMGLMPASFRVYESNGREEITADFGERAIGRVVPADSAMWWMFVLRAYVVASDDWDLVRSDEVQQCIEQILDLYLRETFESAPTLLVPDGAFMIDRRMGVYGHPLEIQALYYGMLITAEELLERSAERTDTLDNLRIRIEALQDYVRLHYWLDRHRLNEIHRFKGEEIGLDVANVLNIYPESIPDWLDGWLDERSGYLVGNQGPGRVDFRFFAQGNLLAILFGLASPHEAQGIMNLFERRWPQLIGEMPVKIVYPACSGKEWMHMTGSDPKNVAWSYHNGGNWPVLIWPFVGAALRTGRFEAAERAVTALTKRVRADNWPEYYDGRHGSLVGRRANYFQTWTASGLLLAHHILENTRARQAFERFTFAA